MNVRSEFHENMKITGHDKMAAAILTLAGAIANSEQTMEVKLVPGSNETFELNVSRELRNLVPYSK